MRKILFIFLVLFLPLELWSQGSMNTTKERIRGFNRISVGYDALFLDHDFKTMNGVNLQYIHGFPLAKKPLFLETGISASFNIRTYMNENYGENGYYWSSKKLFPILSARIPVNLSYNLKLSNKFSIQPLVGINFKVIPIFEYNYELIDDRNNNIYYSEDDVDKVRFQFGWQAGFGFNISKVFVGIQYNMDFLPLAEIMKNYSNDGSWPTPSYFNLYSNSLLISLGFNF